MESEHDKDENKDQLLEGENGDSEHKRIHSEETGSVIIHSETHSRSSSSSSSSSSYSSPPKHLPEEDKESSSNDPEVSLTDSPPVQVMEREDNNNGGDEVFTNYDPNRIPSSVFERSNTNVPAEWSCTSNESLFSIHLGRSSFTADMMKSDELYKSGELLAYSPTLPMPPPPGGEPNAAAVLEPKVVDSDKEDEDVVVRVEQTRKEEDGDKRDSHDEKEQQPAVSWKTPTTSYRSNRSSNSAHSFTFPILAGAASDSASAKAETEEQKKEDKQSEDTQEPAELDQNQKHSTMCRWFSCFPPCPWCCSSRSSCSCS